MTVGTWDSTVPNDALFSEQWDLPKISLGLSSGTDGWDYTTGWSGAVVADLDSGMDVTHPDLSNNLWTNPGEVAGNGVDDDGDGEIDDIHGWNFIDGNNTLTDTYGHGTEVAGTITAQGNNSIGISGVSWRTKIMPLLIGHSAPDSSATIAALNYHYSATSAQRPRDLVVMPPSDMEVYDAGSSRWLGAGSG